MQSEEKVHVVDDDPGIRDSLRMVLEAAAFRVEAFDSAEAYLAANPGETGGCIISDLRMNGMSGLELLEQLRSRGIATPVIMLTGHGDVPAAVYSMKLGANDFLEKPVQHHDLIARIRAVLTEYRNRRTRTLEAARARERLATLTARERELLRALAEGKSSKQIAAELDLSLRTVENHRAHLLAKSGAENVAELVRLCVLAEQA